MAADRNSALCKRKRDFSPIRDGTLVDSAPDIAAAANRMLARLRHEALPVPLLTGFIGHGIPRLVGRMAEHLSLPEAALPEMRAVMFEEYRADPAGLTRPYPGVREALAALAEAGHPLGVCTNKAQDLAVAVLERLGLASTFGIVVGGDSLPVQKPDPAPLLAAFAAVGAPLLYVGDSEVDAATAQAARIPFALFSRGYRKTPVEALPHDFRLDAFDALPGLVAGLR